MLFVLLIPLWLYGILLSPVYTSDNMSSLQFVSFVWLPALACIADRERFVVGETFRECPPMLGLALTSLLAITASAIASEEPLQSLAYVVTAGLGLMTCAGLWTTLRSRFLITIALYSVVGTIFELYIAFLDVRVQGRLTIADAHPNYLGLVSLGFLLCALAVPNRLVASAVIGFNFWIIVETQSRASLLAAFLGLLTYSALKAKNAHTVRAAFALGALALTCTLLAIFYYEPLESYVSSLLFLNDRYRGLGTGFTGRIDAWWEAVDLFRQNPFLGVGFRLHERYMTALSSAHNGYLSLLAEVGVLGTIPILVLVFNALCRVAKKALGGDEVAILGVSFIVGYAFLASFERLFLNMGNPTSVVAWLFLLMPCGRDGPFHHLRHVWDQAVYARKSPEFVH